MSKKPTPLPPKQTVVPILRTVLARVVKAHDLEVHTCMATLEGVTVLDIRDFVPSTGTYGRGTTLPWTPEMLEIMRAGLLSAKDTP